MPCSGNGHCGAHPFAPGESPQGAMRAFNRHRRNAHPAVDGDSV